VTRKCNVCQRMWVKRVGHARQSVCPTCVRATAAMRVARAAGGRFCQPPVAGQADRVEALRELAAKNLPLFAGRRP
jgi:hypothetical protein